MPSLREERVESAIDQSASSKPSSGTPTARGEQVKQFFHFVVISVLALGSAAIVAYSTAHFAHYGLGVSRSALREQALICAAIMVGLVTIEMLASKER